MVSRDKFELLFTLQQLILNTEDSSLLLDKLFSQILERADAVNFSFHFISTLFFNLENQIEKTYFIDENGSQDINKGVNWSILIKNLAAWEKELLWGPVAVYKSKDKQLLDQLISLYPENKEIKLLIIEPVLIAHRLTGITIYGLADETIDKDELEFMELLTDLISLTYRLQDTQISLTNIGQEVYKMNAKLHDLDKLKDDFVSMASHELRTPMTAIRSYAWMALNRSDVPLTEKMKKYLSRTLISTERLINLVNDMLNVSRIEAGRVEVTPKAFDMVALVKEVMEEVRAKAAEKQLNLFVLENKIPEVFADPDKVHQVLLNLIGNALKFTPQSGNITVSFQTDGQVVDISIKDTGAGISKEDIGALFKKFSMVDSSYVASATTGGTGLGLYISKSLVEIMKGRIWVASEGVGKGATFSFSLPISTPEVLQQAADYSVKPIGESKPLEPVAI
jgi:signal transduction histidine kinase